jgi:hypothetical protein
MELMDLENRERERERERDYVTISAIICPFLWNFSLTEFSFYDRTSLKFFSKRLHTLFFFFISVLFNLSL